MLSDKTLPNVNALHFFENVLNAWKSARGETVERFYKIADATVCLRFANDVLVARIAPALEHLRCVPSPSEPANAELTIYLWDSVSTRTPMPAPPWKTDDYGARNEVHGFADERLRAVFHMGSGALSLFDSATNRAVFWIRDARELPYYESGAPLLAIFASWANARSSAKASSTRLTLMHAAAIGNENGGVLLVGRGGSGKSSTALLALNADSPLRYAGDDYCLLAQNADAQNADAQNANAQNADAQNANAQNADAQNANAKHENAQPWVHSLYSSGKVHAHDAERFGFLRASLWNEANLGEEKALYFLGENPGARDKMIAGFPIRAILLPRVTGKEETRLVSSRAAQSLLALAPSTIFQLPNAGADEFRAMSSLVRQVPSFVLELGTDRAQILRPIVELLA